MVKKENVTKIMEDLEESKKNQFPDDIWGKYSWLVFMHRGKPDNWFLRMDLNAHDWHFCASRAAGHACGSEWTNEQLCTLDLTIARHDLPEGLNTSPNRFFELLLDFKEVQYPFGKSTQLLEERIVVEHRATASVFSLPAAAFVYVKNATEGPSRRDPRNYITKPWKHLAPVARLWGGRPEELVETIQARESLGPDEALSARFGLLADVILRIPCRTDYMINGSWEMEIRTLYEKELRYYKSQLLEYYLDEDNQYEIIDDSRFPTSLFDDPEQQDNPLLRYFHLLMVRKRKGRME